ncbi:uncharacterized protein TM35_000232300 [Trypanosoma theileri]|uniref:Uncharacterized protein n=1 Tax=Trypanosoma theileri TaxID=67003 RepID=A0A1X0NSU5_9TRYP|nr:uncharacterized protein TM35_000232300 [Trypanosoma theileri]ORC87259.1 hypothetical protein TM35_000232300 [Trypanosoma theileri]
MDITGAQANDERPGLNYKGERSPDAAPRAFSENRDDNINGSNDNKEQCFTGEGGGRRRRRSLHKGFSEKTVMSSVPFPEASELQDTLAGSTLDKNNHHSNH